ncbi:MAG: ABC transporter permease [Syntrophales bacterium]|jgi:putative ABC transport system permease protein|nr:ABC transporter permease [Syntrophales bacterium]MCK9527665.1 ABC transporter permease [Syntrophales bacterium]MDX9922283.1 ABC transporter permease [Syntrophales bacterium]
MLWNALLLALRELRRNKMRSFLTMLGIIIGVAAVITLVTLGGGATRQVTDQISAMGSNLLMVRPGKHMGPGQSSGARPFKLRDAEALEREIPDLAAVSPTMSSAATAIYANENWNTTISAGTEQFFFVNNRKLELGRLFTANEVRSGAAVCVIGETIKQKLFDGADPIGARLRLNRLSCEVIGTLVAKGQSSMGHDQDDLVVIPLRTFQRRVAGNTDISMIQVSMRDGVETEAVQAEIKRVLRERRHLSVTQEDDFDVMDMKEIATMLSGTTKVLTGLLGAVAAVSLLVGGIGIMNIMLVSVTERTREIGTRLAIGALEWEVLLQFLVEAVVLSSCGGLIGIAMAMTTSFALTSVLEVPFVFNGTIIITAFLFSAAVGVVFGYFPARKAAQMNPIEALRHE